jgi:phage gp46-like protein
MSDIALKIDGENFDVAIANGDLEMDEGLETAVALSLFCDARVSDEELPQGQTVKRGFWADKYSSVDGDVWGSRLWTLAREKRQVAVLRKAEDFVKEALEWLVEDGVATSITATASFTAGTSNAWEILIVIQKPAGRTSRYQVLWDKQELKRLS